MSCSEEAEALVGQAIDEFAAARRIGHAPPSYIFFLGRENFPPRYAQGVKYELGRAQVLHDNSKGFLKSMTLVSAGALVEQCLKAAHLLADAKIGTVVINASSINHPDVETVGDALKQTGGHLITVEDHEAIGGMGSLLLQALANEGVSVKARTLGVDNEFGQSAYAALDLYRKHGLDSESIAKAAIAHLK